MPIRVCFAIYRKCHMKVLWLTNFLMPDHAKMLQKEASPRGGWMPALAEALVDSKKITLAVATNISGKCLKQGVVNGVQYYSVPCAKNFVKKGFLCSSLIQGYRRVIEDFQPDVIHIHGTEYFQGLITAQNFINCSTVVSIQGIINACQRHYWGGLSFSDLLCSRTFRDWLRLDGLFEQKYRLNKRAKFEEKIFSSNDAFIGRTRWDRAHTRRFNPGARYYHCEELIRHPFYKGNWNIGQVRKHTIFVSGASYPLKGFHVLVKAAAILRHEFPDIQIRTPLARFNLNVGGGRQFWQNLRVGGYARYLKYLICKEKLEKSIVPMATLSADEMVRELSIAHVFVLPSFMENSPNSLAEAMLVGVPSIASYVGGVPSLVDDEKTALLFPSGDETALADQIRRIFLEDKVAQGLSIRARKVARSRHEKERIVKTMLQIYYEEFSKFNKI